MPKTVAIVVSYNGMLFIDNCLKSLLDEVDEIVVVDNNSSDATVNHIENNYPAVTLIKSVQNLGFGKGNNLGLRYAYEKGYDYFLLLNQDAALNAGAIAATTPLFEEEKTFGILSPINYNGEGTKLDWYFEYCMGQNADNAFVNDLFFGALKPVYSVNFMHAACWIISRDCLEKTGLFDPLFPHYGEDNDFAQRVLLKGFKIGVATKASVRHIGKFSSDTKKTEQQLQYLKFIDNLVTLKNLKFTLKYNVYQLLFLKLPDLLRYLITLKRGLFLRESKPLVKALKQLRSIKMAREKSFLEKAFFIE